MEEIQKIFEKTPEALTGALNTIWTNIYNFEELYHEKIPEAFQTYIGGFYTYKSIFDMEEEYEDADADAD